MGWSRPGAGARIAAILSELMKCSLNLPSAATASGEASGLEASVLAGVGVKVSNPFATLLVVATEGTFLKGSLADF